MRRGAVLTGDPITDAAIASTLRAMAASRAPVTFCPSEAARALASDEDVWRPLMPRIRAIADSLPEILATQKGVEVEAGTARGPIRLAQRQPRD